MRRMGFLAVAVAALLLAGCGAQKVGVYLVDAPLDTATHVYVTLTGLRVAFTPPSDAGISREVESVVFSEPKKVDLLSLKNGGTRLLLGELDAQGVIHHLDLEMTGEATVVFADGTEQVAKVPSGAQSGIKIVGPIDLSSSGDITLDFRADQSIVDTGNGKLILKPVIRVTTERDSKADGGIECDQDGCRGDWSGMADGGMDCKGGRPDEPCGGR